MAWYAVVDMDGKVLRTGSCPESMIAAQAGDAEVAVETSGEIGDMSHYFTAYGFVAYPPKPGEWARFNYQTEEWFDPRSIEDLYDEAQAYVRAFRDAVNTKRLKVITVGTTVSVTGHGSVALQGRPEDQTSLQGLAFGAQLRLGMGDSTTLMDFLDRENVLHQLVPMQMLELWQKGAAFISAVYARSWVIKEMNPETTNIEDPLLWSIS